MSNGSVSACREQMKCHVFSKSAMKNYPSNRENNWDYIDEGDTGLLISALVSNAILR